jgi:hypothetical protein
MRYLILTLITITCSGWINQAQQERMGELATTFSEFESYGLNSGLVSYYSMRTSGTTVRDEWGTTPGTAINSPVFSFDNGIRDMGAGFSLSISNYISMGDAHDLGTNNWTFSLWFNLERVSGNNTLLHKWVLEADHTRYFIDVFDGVLRFFIRDAADTTGVFVSSAGISTNQWYQAVVTLDRAALMTMYINGVAVSSGNISSESGDMNSSGIFQISGQTDFQGEVSRFIDGSVDEVGIWQRLLTSNEVYNLYSIPLYAPYKD